jgi:hypothetical protein
VKHKESTRKGKPAEKPQERGREGKRCTVDRDPKLRVADVALQASDAHLLVHHAIDALFMVAKCTVERRRNWRDLLALRARLLRFPAAHFSACLFPLSSRSLRAVKFEEEEEAFARQNKNSTGQTNAQKERRGSAKKRPRCACRWNVCGSASEWLLCKREHVSFQQCIRRRRAKMNEKTTQSEPYWPTALVSSPSNVV